MKKLKVVTVLGTRPEIIRLSRVMACLDRYCDHVIVHTGQNHDYELNEIFFRDLELRKPDHFLSAAGANGAETIGKVIVAVDRVLEEIRPDAMLVLGDTNSCMAVIPAKRRKIPVFHMEAGNRCFDQRVPEEIKLRVHRGGLPTMTADGEHTVGPVPGVRGLYVAGGCCVGGLSMAPAIGEALAAWITDGAPPLDLSPLAPGREGTMDEEALRVACRLQYAHHYWEHVPPS